MIQASQAWVAAHEQVILPETFVEISYGVVDEEAQRSFSVSAGDEERFSNADNIAVTSVQPQYYATLEHNLWLLDGTRNVFDPSSASQNIGYVAEGGRNASVQLSFPRVMTAIIPGITITWSSEYSEYPMSYTVTARNGSAVVATKTFTENTDVTSIADIELSGYDSIFIETHDWSVPDHRHRIDGVTIGIGVTFTKRDLISFSHECEGDLCSGAIPKNSITFSLDNSTGVWNPNNPQGSVKYLAERQKLKVRYGMRIGDEIEWVEAGTFYLSEWDTPTGGMEATFVARDIFEYLLNTQYPVVEDDDLETLVKKAFQLANVPSDFNYAVSSSMQLHNATTEEGRTAAEIVQMCANAMGYIIKQDRLGKLHITPLVKESSGFTIQRRASLSDPEVTLSKPLKIISIDYGDNSHYSVNVSSNGETQTVSNPMITSTEQCSLVVDAVRDSLITRKTISGEFRADPRLDLFDIVRVESKYGDIYPVALTHIKYRYNGSFWATYSGRVLDPGVMED